MNNNAAFLSSDVCFTRHSDSYMRNRHIYRHEFALLVSATST